MTAESEPTSAESLTRWSILQERYELEGMALWLMQKHPLDRWEHEQYTQHNARMSELLNKRLTAWLDAYQAWYTEADARGEPRLVLLRPNHDPVYRWLHGHKSLHQQLCRYVFQCTALPWKLDLLEQAFQNKAPDVRVYLKQIGSLRPAELTAHIDRHLSFDAMDTRKLQQRALSLAFSGQAWRALLTVFLN